MCLVRLSDSQTLHRFSSVGPEGLTSAHAKSLQDHLHFVHRIEVPIKLIAQRLYVRISAHVYNNLHHYEKLADAIMPAAKL